MTFLKCNGCDYQEHFYGVDLDDLILNVDIDVENELLTRQINLIFH